jgi:hypothetical protein
LNVFANGTTADGTQVNANFNSLIAAGNNINSTNIGSLGVYANQIIPTTAAQATFGGVLAYTFPAGLNVTAGLVANGTFVANVGILTTEITLSALVATPVGNQASIGTDGGTQLIARATGYAFQTAAGANLFQIPASGMITAGLFGPATISSTGFINSAATASSGALVLGGTTSSVAFTFDGTKFNFTNTAGASTANITVSTGAYVQTSDSRLKQNVAVLTYGLSEINALRPVEFNWIDGNAASIGFIAQELALVIPEAVAVVDEKTGIMGVSDSTITPVVVRSIQELSAAFNAYVAAHP